MNRTIEGRVELWKQFYAKKNEHPLFGFFVGSEYPVARYRASKSLPEKRALVPSDFSVDAFLDDNDRLFEAHEACGGDFIWAADAFWGIQWIECLCGLPMFCNHKSANLHFQTLDLRYSESAFCIQKEAQRQNFNGTIPVFDPQNEWAQLAAEFLDKGAARAAGRYPLATTRMRGISDMLSALYGGENFIYQLMDEPDETREVCRKLTDLYVAFSKFQLEHIPDFHGGIGSFYYSNWAPKGTVWHQEDTAAMLSPAMYAEHFKEWDEQIVNSFENNIMHMRSTGFIPLDDYLGMNFTAMELHIDTGGPSAEELYETHKKILAKKPLLIWGDISEKDLDWIFSKLPPQGLAVNTVIESPEQARELYKKYMG